MGQSAVWIMSSNIFHTTNTTPVLNIIRTTTTAVFKLQYPPSLKYPQEFFQDILVHNQSISIMNNKEREAFHITLTFLVGLAFLLVAAVVIYFLHLLYRFVIEHQCRCLCTSRNRENTQNTSLNRSACYINMEVISNNNEPPRYNQIPITTIPTTTMLSPPRSSDNNTERLHEEPPPSY